MKKLRHILAFVLALSMVFCMMPSVFAGGIRVESEHGIPVTQEGGDGIAVKSELSSVWDKFKDTVSDVVDRFTGNKAETLEGAEPVSDTKDEYSMNIVHLDCGRKYFSVDSIKQIIDNAADSGFNYIELAVGNDGMSFLLNDMSLEFTVDGEGYSWNSQKVSEAIHNGNLHYNTSFVSNGSYDDKVNGGYYTPDVNELTQSEMDEIIAYAYSKGVEVIPLINSPGHMHTILQAMNTLTGTENGYKADVWNGSKYETLTSERTINIANEVAKEFTKTFISKYINYFASKGCKYFNLGADEYANDICDSGEMGFGSLITNGLYDDFAEYVNEVAALIKEAGMRPIAFNDGIYFKETTQAKTSYESEEYVKVVFDKDIIISYWSSGWDPYLPASASWMRNKGHSLINTNGDYYWVLGGKEVDASTTKNFSSTSFMEYYKTTEEISDPVGSMFCIWCDYPGNKTEEYIVSTTKAPMAAFGNTLPETGRTVHFKVGETYTIDADGEVAAIIADSDIVSATYAYDETEATTELAEVSVNDIVSGKQYYIGYNKSHYLKAEYQRGGYSLTDSTTADCLWTITGDSTNGYTISTIINNQTKYLWYSSSVYSYGKTYSLKLDDNKNNKWQINDGMFYATTENWWGTIYYCRLGYSNGWNIATSGVDMTLYELKEIPGKVNSTTITITAISEGETSVKVGNLTYNFVVESSPLNVEYWITNAKVSDGSGNTSASILKTQAARENGVLFSTFVPQTASREGATAEKQNNLVFWKGTRLTAGNKQVSGGTDQTLNGDDFKYVRYIGDKWQISADGEEWSDVNSTDQIVAYYIQTTEVTDEVITDVVDWGHTPYTGLGSQYANKYVLLDFAVKFQSGGDRVPSIFPSDEKTIAYHCDYNGNNGITVFYDGDADNDVINTYNYYRRINTIVAQESEGYEVYMITLTPSNANHGSINYTLNPTYYQGGGGTSDPTKVTSYSYDYANNEKVVWVASEDDLGEFADKKYTSISNTVAYNYRVGGEPTVNAVEIYNSQAMLVTYYVRAEETPDSLKVHYIDKTANEQFYEYAINVKSGTDFSVIGFENNKVTNGSVVNDKGNTQTVTEDLSKMPEVSAKYRYSSYKCVGLTVSEDKKEVYLYYEFDYNHSFVIDFGQPVKIVLGDIGVSDTTYNSVSFPNANSLKYGTITHDGLDKGMTYTPNKIMTGVETIQVLFKGDNTDGNAETDSALHFIYLYPATNVLYEETVADLPKNGGWDKVEYDGSWQAENITAQATEALGEESVHGYDDIYSENTGFSAGSAYVATLTAGNAQTSTKGAVTFTFTGTGFDLISECGPDTGLLLANLYKGTGDDKVLKRIIMADTYFTGDDQYIKYSDTDEYGVLDYQVPVIRKLNLDYDTYTVEVYGYMIERENVATASYSMDSYDFTESIIAKVADEFGFDDDPSLYEIVFMDENSILNGGTGESPFDDYSVSVMSADTVDSSTSTKTGYIYIDGIRVYETMENVVYATAENNTTYYSIVEEAKEGTTTFNEGSFVYVEGTGSQADLKDYQKTGPQNEIYLISGATLAFELNGYVATQTNKDSIQIAARAVNGSPTMFDNVVMEGNTSIELTTSTEMYYNVNVSESNGKSYLMITCNSSDEKTAILSISGIKLPHGVTINTSPSEEVKTAVYAKVCAIGSDEFVPSVFTVNVNSSVKSGKSIMITAQTSTDVDKIIVEYQDESYELTPNNKTMVECEMSSVYTYSKSFKTAKSAEKGDVELTFVACSSDDNSVTSEPITKTVTIK